MLFEFDAESASLFERIQRRLGWQLFGVEMPDKTINYVWSSQIPVGRSWPSPHHADARLVAVASNSIGSAGEGWQEMVVDLSVDAKRLFPSSGIGRPYALAVMVDADDSCQEAIAWFSDFRFLGPASPDPQAP